LVYDFDGLSSDRSGGDRIMPEYVHPEVLVSTDWVAEHASDPNVRVVESNEDRALYTQGHIPGAVEIDWAVDLQDQNWRDYIDRAAFERLCAERGISNDTTVVFYGDKNNWWACYAFWVFKLYGHKDCRIMNGGRKRWELDGRPWSTERVTCPRGTYTAQEQDGSIRALRDEVLKHQKAGKQLLDVRSPEEYRGERMHMPDYPNEGAVRGGHIPGALNVPWPLNCNDDGTFKSVKELEKLYVKELRMKRRSPTIAYCRIGERSSLSWFVLRYLLGFGNVKNYDGSWLEWGNCVRVPIVKGSAPGGQPAAAAASPAAHA
jgi:thiosulfate/3-mercaptopyruvate sulfurtransferase